MFVLSHYAGHGVLIVEHKYMTLDGIKQGWMKITGQSEDVWDEWRACNADCWVMADGSEVYVGWTEC